MTKSLIGIWMTDPEDLASLEEYGRVSIEFSCDGRLTYSISKSGMTQVILMTYRVEKNVLIVDQPSDPSEERVVFEIDQLGKLILFSQPISSTYIRVSGSK